MGVIFTKNNCTRLLALTEAEALNVLVVFYTTRKLGDKTYTMLYSYKYMNTSAA
jgi:hypothetical protein